MMTFDELWPTLVIPGEYDAMDELDQARWRGVLRQAFEAGRKDSEQTAKVWEREAERRSDRLFAAVEQARREEREACAKLVETLHETSWPDTIAAAIRARGEGK